MEKINANACCVEGVSSISVSTTELRGRSETGKPEALTAVQLTLTLPKGEQHNLLMSAREAAALAESIDRASAVAHAQNETRERDEPGARIEHEIRALLEPLPLEVLQALRDVLKRV